MRHYKACLPETDFLGAQDFPEPREVTISRVVGELVVDRDTEAKKRFPMLYIIGSNGQEYHRKYKVPATVMHGLAVEFGPDVDQWAGKKVTIYAAKCMAFGILEECLRIKFTDKTEQSVLKFIKKKKINPKAYKA